MAVVGTPLNHLKNNTGNITPLAPNTDAEVYGNLTPVSAPDAQKWILEQQSTASIE